VYFVPDLGVYDYRDKKVVGDVFVRFCAISNQDGLRNRFVPEETFWQLISKEDDETLKAALSTLKCLPLTELSSTMLRPANPVREVIDQIP
jgi:hypothetical protein